MAHMGLARNFEARITMPFWEIIKIISIKWQESASSGHVGNEWSWRELPEYDFTIFGA